MPSGRPGKARPRVYSGHFPTSFTHDMQSVLLLQQHGRQARCLSYRHGFCGARGQQTPPPDPKALALVRPPPLGHASFPSRLPAPPAVAPTLLSRGGWDTITRRSTQTGEARPLLSTKSPKRSAPTPCSSQTSASIVPKSKTPPSGAFSACATANERGERRTVGRETGGGQEVLSTWKLNYFITVT